MAVGEWDPIEEADAEVGTTASEEHESDRAQ